MYSKEMYKYNLPVASKVKSYEKKSNQYIISMNYLFSDAEYIIDSEYYYGSIKDLNNKTNSIVKVYNDLNAQEKLEYLDAQKYLDNNYNNIEDKLTTYTYTFEKQGNRIILTNLSVN